MIDTLSVTCQSLDPLSMKNKETMDQVSDRTTNHTNLLRSTTLSAEASDAKDQANFSSRATDLARNTLRASGELKSSRRLLGTAGGGESQRVSTLQNLSSATQKTKQITHSSRFQLEAKKKAPSFHQSNDRGAAISEGKEEAHIRKDLASLKSEESRHQTKDELLENSGILQLIERRFEAQATLMDIEIHSPKFPQTYLDGPLSDEVLNSEKYRNATQTIDSFSKSMTAADKEFGELISERFKAVQSAFERVRNARLDGRGYEGVGSEINYLLRVIETYEFGEVVDAARTLRVKDLSAYNEHMKNARKVMVWTTLLKLELPDIEKAYANIRRSWTIPAIKGIDSAVRAILTIIDKRISQESDPDPYLLLSDF